MGIIFFKLIIVAVATLWERLQPFKTFFKSRTILQESLIACFGRNKTEARPIQVGRSGRAV